MPAMSKEKTSATPLSENKKDLKLKDQVCTIPVINPNATATPTVRDGKDNHVHQPQQKTCTNCRCGSHSSINVGSSCRKNPVGNEHPLNGPNVIESDSTNTSSMVPRSTVFSSTEQFNGDNDQWRKKPCLQYRANKSAVSDTNPLKLVSAKMSAKKSPNDYIFGKYIGEGSFSIVYLAVDVQTKREYAIKVCEKRHILREHKQDYIRREREVMHIMTNVSGFVNLSCTFQDHRSLYFVMTYAKNGDLLPYINKVGSFDIECTRHYAAELVLACEEMHRRNVVHRDLKPENILLDENMHTLIADFGSAKILTPEERSALLNAEDKNDKNDNSGDDMNMTIHANLQQRGYYKRRGSFVGTAQYVSPEVLQNKSISPAADLWALGCIVYQMISGLPPFHGNNDYIIFKEILACKFEFPQGFNENAKDLVKRLLKIDPLARLGALDKTYRYESIRSHPFFDGIDFDTVRQQTPPTIYPYLPNEEFHPTYHLAKNLEPGLDDKQRTRLLGTELGTSISDTSKPSEAAIETITRSIFYISEKEKKQRLEQQKADKWHSFADNEVILKKGYIQKRKGLFARKRMLLLTTGPRLIYIDPAQMTKKGEIPWSPELRVEAKNFKIFFIHTPNRTYYLEDPEGYSLEWVDAIENVHILTYKCPPGLPTLTTEIAETPSK